MGEVGWRAAWGTRRGPTELCGAFPTKHACGWDKGERRRGESRFTHSTTGEMTQARR